MEAVCVGQLFLSMRPGGNRMEAEAQQCPDSRQGSVDFIGLYLVKGFWGNNAGNSNFPMPVGGVDSSTQEWSRSVMDTK